MPIPNLTRREFLHRAATGAAGLAAAAMPGVGSTQDTPTRKPNLLYVFSDQHRAASWPGAEYTAPIAPNMERLASEGVHFSHCVSNYPVCSPYRAMLMSGKWPYESGVIDNSLPLPDDGTSLGHTFRQAGYGTGYVGKWHLGPPPKGASAGHHGFDWFRYWGKTNDHWHSLYIDDQGQRRTTEGYNATLMTDMALEFIQENRGHPWFLMTSWNPPHSNFTDAPDAQQARYDPEAISFAPNVPPERRDDPRLRKMMQGYLAHITAIDLELGRLLDRLTEWELADDTIVVYSSDHGEMGGSQNRTGKRLPWHESALVPFLIRWPGTVPAGVTCPSLFTTIDIYPSLCGLTGIPVPDHCSGRDLSTLFRGQPTDPEPESALLMHIAKEHASGGLKHPADINRGVETRRYTYAVREDAPWLLYDNQEDPYQERNLIDDPARASVRSDLHALLGDWLKTAQDPFELRT